MRSPDLTSNHAKREADGKDAHEPVLGRLAVPAHQPQVDIRLLKRRTARARPDVLAVKERDVHNGGHEGRKGHAVREREGGAEHERRVLLVGRLVERVVGREDTARIVRVAKMVKVGVGADGEVPVEFGPRVREADGAQHHHQDADAHVGDGEGGGL